MFIVNSLTMINTLLIKSELSLTSRYNSSLFFRIWKFISNIFELENFEHLFLMRENNEFIVYFDARVYHSYMPITLSKLVTLILYFLNTFGSIILNFEDKILLVFKKLKATLK